MMREYIDAAMWLADCELIDYEEPFYGRIGVDLGQRIVRRGDIRRDEWLG